MDLEALGASKRFTKEEVTRIVNRETDTDAMSRQAAVDANGVDKVNLKQRLDDDFNGVKSQLAETALQRQSLKNIKNSDEIVNIFDKLAMITDGFFNSSGAFINDQSTQSSDFIPVIYGHSYSKSNGGIICYWDKDKNFIMGESASNFTITDENIKYITFTVPLSTKDTYMCCNSAVLPSGFINYSAESKAIVLEKEFTIIKNNPYAKPLFIEDFSGYNQPYHPSVCYIPEGFAGYTYWMVQTPFPKGKLPYRDRWECPCVYASNNGIDWTPIKNPLDDLTEAEIANGDYFSDPHIFYNRKSLRLEVWYRITHRNGELLPTTVLKKITPDAVTWGSRATVIDLQAPDNGVGDMVRSPAISFDTVLDKYRMWYVDGAPGVNGRHVSYSESLDGLTWSAKVDTTLSGHHNIDPWHMDLQYVNGIYHLLVLGANVGDTVLKLWYFTSTDGLNFDFKKIMLEPNGIKGSYHSFQVYRSCLLFNGSCWRMYFTEEDDDKSYIGLMEGSTPLTMDIVDINSNKYVVDNLRLVNTANSVTEMKLADDGSGIGYDFTLKEPYFKNKWGTLNYFARKPIYNLFDKSKARTDGYYDKTTGAFIASASTLASDFIPIDYIDGFTIHYTKSSAHSFVFWDINKAYVSYGDGTDIPITSSAYAFVTVNFPATSLDTYMVVKGATIPPMYIPFGNEHWHNN